MLRDADTNSKRSDRIDSGLRSLLRSQTLYIHAHSLGYTGVLVDTLRHIVLHDGGEQQSVGHTVRHIKK